MSYKLKLPSINTFIFDVDGVLTDGTVILYKDEVVRTINARDGYALQYASKMGYNIFIITGGDSQAVKDRLINAGAKEVILKASNKVKVYEELKEKYNFKDEEVLYMGDDIPDYNVMRKVGVSTCPQDAAIEIKNISDYQSPLKGGHHCVRDVIEQTLRVQGKWFTDQAHEW
ncbi:3-deoxy-D-manno-octulosonate 8-phosphate phosphatase [Brumimicrobium glaciale]|uniref:3-deoxy-D-manno-octulosonate 8-phosphate phosphatase n=1 Tax=Brumimicrobium glaciale TaxID=200475 RepID=A0A4Q4KNE1_9FLAO|nr:HAD family hydrolase [Brumimicrobium glaciale]RYM34882.1 3-deoxy-D-manno-octulosonate 8-phosphate phosphatase [Brumimicrobium glaciale]